MWKICDSHAHNLDSAGLGGWSPRVRRAFTRGYSKYFITLNLGLLLGHFGLLTQVAPKAEKKFIMLVGIMEPDYHEQLIVAA